MSAVICSQDEVRFYQWYEAVDEIFQRSRHSIKVHRRGENDNVCVFDFRKQRAHVVFVYALAGRLGPAGHVAETRIQVKLAGVDQFYLAVLFSQSF